VGSKAGVERNGDDLTAVGIRDDIERNLDGKRLRWTESLQFGCTMVDGWLIHFYD